MGATIPSSNSVLMVLGAGAGLVGALAFLYSLYSRKKKVAVVRKLIIYPIKSCKGVEVPSAECTPHGLAYHGLRDRQFLVVSADTYVGLTARSHPTLVLIESSFDESTSELRINAPDMEELRVSLSGPQDKVAISGICLSFKYEALDCGKEAAVWFTRYLGADVKLLYHDQQLFQRHVEDVRGCEYTRQSRPNQQNAVTMMADGYPYNLLSEASVEQTNADLSGSKVTYRNFRPNILVASLEGPFAEDNWRAIDINGVRMFCEKPCSRCRLPNVDPDTGIPNARAEPLNTLNRTRIKRQINKGKPVFGIYLILDGDNGRITVGDDVLG